MTMFEKCWGICTGKGLARKQPEPIGIRMTGWVPTPHNLFLYSDPPLLCHPPSYCLRLFSSQNFFHIITPTFLKPSHSTPTCLWRWNRQSVPKRRHIKFRHPGITQKKAYKIHFYVL